MNAPDLFLQRLGVDDLEPASKPSLRQIGLLVAERHGVSLAELRGPSHARRFAYPRHEAWHLTYATGRFSDSKIGGFYGARDHTTVRTGRLAHAARMRGEKLVPNPSTSKSETVNSVNATL